MLVLGPFLIVAMVAGLASRPAARPGLDRANRSIFSGGSLPAAGLSAGGPGLLPAGTTRRSDQVLGGSPAASGWSIQPTSNPLVPTGTLSAVACAASHWCIGVGTYDNPAGKGATLAEEWNGAAWSLQHPVNPTTAAYGYLGGVSCPSINSCTAVGNFVDPSGHEEPLVEAWNGASWNMQRVPMPTGAPAGALYGISCTSGRACTAVGNSTNLSGKEVPLAEGWNGAAWSAESPADRGGADASSLFGVSCTSDRTCVAVGNSSSSSGKSTALVEAWNGTTWTMQKPPTPPDAATSALAAVSCGAPDACTAVGNYTNNTAVEVTLAEKWNGTGWTLETTPNPSGATPERAGQRLMQRAGRLQGGWEL